MFDQLKQDLGSLGIALLIAVIIVVIFIYRRIQKKRQDPQEQVRTQGSGSTKKTIIGSVATAGSAVGVYSIWSSPLGIGIAATLTLAITIALFFLIRYLRSDDNPLDFGGGGGGIKDKIQDRIDKLKQGLDLKQDIYNYFGIDTKSGDRFLRAHHGNKTLIHIVTKDGKLIVYDPMKQFDFGDWTDESGELHHSTTLDMQGYDYPDLNQETVDGVTTVTTPEGNLVIQYEETASPVDSVQDNFNIHHVLD